MNNEALDDPPRDKRDVALDIAEKAMSRARSLIAASHGGAASVALRDAIARIAELRK